MCLIRSCSLEQWWSAYSLARNSNCTGCCLVLRGVDPAEGLLRLHGCCLVLRGIDPAEGFSAAVIRLWWSEVPAC
jgi:hypothetical protein